MHADEDCYPGLAGDSSALPIAETGALLLSVHELGRAFPSRRGGKSVHY
jgi:hypothetical protein